MSPWTRPAALALSLAALLCAAGCGSASPAEQADTAQAALSKGDYATARATARDALAADGVAADKALAWKLERIGVEAAAGEADGAAVLADLERLAGAYPTQVTAEWYAKLGNRLADSGDPSGALDVADAGKKRFTEHQEAFDALIAALTARSESDPELADKLRAMGYL